MDEILRLSENPNVILTTYGDLLRVPGSVQGDNLQRRKALGADVRMVYSPMDSLDLSLIHILWRQSARCPSSLPRRSSV